MRQIRESFHVTKPEISSLHYFPRISKLTRGITNAERASKHSSSSHSSNPPTFRKSKECGRVLEEECVFSTKAYVSPVQ